MLTSSWTVTWMWGRGWPPLPVVTPRSRWVVGSVLRMRMVLGLPDPDLLVRDTDPHPDPSSYAKTLVPFGTVL
jgi:hypothetical protein